VKELLYFDGNASYGPRLGKYQEERWTLAHLIEDMDLAGIAGALVLHAQALHYDPMVANLALIKDIKPYRNRLFPCWMAMPALSGDFPSVPEFMEGLRQNDVRAVRLEPRTFGLPIEEAVWGELRDALRQEELLVVTSAEGYPGLETFDRFMAIFHSNPVLLLNAYWDQWRRVVYLMNTHPNLHLEFSSFQANRAIEYMAEHYGAERCLFGTNLPKKAPGAARGFVDWTLLPARDAVKVAGGNLKRLLGGHGPKRIPAPGKWSDSITAAARQGEPLPCDVLDDHCHVLHDGGSNAGGTFVMHHGDADGMIELIRKIGVDKTAVMSWAGPLSGDTDRGNEIVANAVRRYPNELLGVVTVRPELQTTEEIAATIRKYHDGLKFPGLKPFPRTTMNFDDPGFDTWYAYANAHGLYMVYDLPNTGAEGMAITERLVQKYPNMTLHLDHCGRSWPYAKWAVELIQRFPKNVYAQLNYTLVTNGVIEYIAESVGDHHVLFGTDAPMRDPRPQAGWLVFTRLPEKSKRKIFGANFARILKQAFRGGPENAPTSARRPRRKT